MKMKAALFSSKHNASKRLIGNTILHFRTIFPSFLSSDLKFECLATWRDGSDTFIYGGFSGDGVISRDRSYRCFVSETSLFLS